MAISTVGFGNKPAATPVAAAPIPLRWQNLDRPIHRNTHGEDWRIDREGVGGGVNLQSSFWGEPGKAGSDPIAARFTFGRLTSGTDHRPVAGASLPGIDPEKAR